MKTTLLYALIFFFFPIGINAQDTVFKTDGTKIEGSVTVQNKERNDIVSIENLKIDANQVDRILFENGSELISKELTYYNSKSKIEITKYALLEPILNGDAVLYAYDSKDFGFALLVHNSIHALQELPTDIDTESQTYKVVLLINLQECAPRPDIFGAQYSLNSIASLVNTFNSCKNGNYEVIEKYKTNPKFESSFFTLALGLNHASHSFKNRLRSSDGFYLEEGTIDQKRATSNTLLFEFFIQNNLFNSHNIYLQTGFSINKLNFEITTIDGDLSADNVTANEINLNFGVNYKFVPNKLLSPELTAGAYFWDLMGQKNTYSELTDEYPVFETENTKNYGLGFYVQGALRYIISDKVTSLIGIKYLQKLDQNIFTWSVDDRFRNVIDDSFKNNIIVSVGVVFNTSANK